MHRTLASLILAAVFASSSTAHDFWLQPEDFTSASAGTIEVVAKVGHTDDTSEWPAEPARVISLRVVSDDATRDHQAVLDMSIRESKGKFAISTEAEGFHVLAIESTKAVSELPAERFEAFLEEEGLVSIARYRIENSLTKDVGREVYSRRGKALLKVGDGVNAADEHVTRPLGQTLEITPLMNPYRLKQNEPLSLQVTYRGKPLSGATVHVVNLDPKVGDIAKIKSNVDGKVVIDALTSGQWMLQTVWSSPYQGDSRGDYDTVFASLSFEIKNAAQ